VRRPVFIARQAERPSGPLGRIIGAVMALETRSVNDEVLRHLGIAQGERILEIGFGHGRTLERAARGAPLATFAGIDHAPDMEAALRRRGADLIESGRLELRVADSTRLPWSNGSFDAAFAVHTIYFWPDLRRQFGEVARVLRRGGRLAVGFRERSPESEAAVPAAIYRLRSKEEVLAALAESGFEARTTAGPGQGIWVVDGTTK